MLPNSETLPTGIVVGCRSCCTIIPHPPPFLSTSFFSAFHFSLLTRSFFERVTGVSAYARKKQVCFPCVIESGLIRGVLHPNFSL